MHTAIPLFSPISLSPSSADPLVREIEPSVASVAGPRSARFMARTNRFRSGLLTVCVTASSQADISVQPSRSIAYMLFAGVAVAVRIVRILATLGGVQLRCSS